MRRREFIALMGGAAAWPLTARAQGVPLVGFVNAASSKTYQKQVAAFEKELAEYGYVDGKNISILYRWAEDRNERLPELAAELVRSHVTVIAATSLPAAAAAKSISSNIPIVFEAGADPIHSGLVTSLNRPGPNITGVTQSNVEIAPKRLQILHELIPTARRAALLLDPTIPTIVQAQSKSKLGGTGLRNRIERHGRR